MKFKKRDPLNLFLGTGLYLVENLRERLPDNMDDIKGRASETYETASERQGRATNAQGTSCYCCPILVCSTISPIR